MKWEIYDGKICSKHWSKADLDILISTDKYIPAEATLPIGIMGDLPAPSCMSDGGGGGGVLSCWINRFGHHYAAFLTAKLAHLSIIAKQITINI